MNHVSEITKIRRRVLIEVARLQWENRLLKDIDDLPEKLVQQHDQRYRCCEYKEKAIYAERIKLAMGLTLKEEYHKKPLSELAKKALEFPVGPDYQVEVIDIACDSCPINKFFVSNACRNCLIHSCQQVCPRGAISIVQNQAYIDQNKCVECGLCKKSCRFGAILEIHRPCEQACGVGAIKSGENRISNIDHNKCVDCGACITSCPFGAISDRAQILKTINMLQTNEKVVALVAPAIVGQFGRKVSLNAIIEALQKMGFSQVVEVALGADLVAVAEGAEFLRRVPHEIKYLTSSCCPAFVKLIEKHHPNIKENMSTYVSPMLAAANLLKEQDPNTKVVFIGPCVAKKGEALHDEGVDTVITFEELAALLVAKGINVSEFDGAGIETKDASALGQGFASTGGVSMALLNSLPKDKQDELNYIKAEGVHQCNEELNNFEKNLEKANYLEGMACEGGCLGGPGTLSDQRITSRLLKDLCRDNEVKQPLDNPVVQEVLVRHPRYLHRNKD